MDNVGRGTLAMYNTRRVVSPPFLFVRKITRNIIASRKSASSRNQKGKPFTASLLSASKFSNFLLDSPILLFYPHTFALLNHYSIRDASTNVAHFFKTDYEEIGVWSTFRTFGTRSEPWQKEQVFINYNVFIAYPPSIMLVARIEYAIINRTFQSNGCLIGILFFKPGLHQIRPPEIERSYSLTSSGSVRFRA